MQTCSLKSNLLFCVWIITRLSSAPVDPQENKRHSFLLVMKKSIQFNFLLDFIRKGCDKRNRPRLRPPPVSLKEIVLSSHSFTLSSFFEFPLSQFQQQLSVMTWGVRDDTAWLGVSFSLKTCHLFWSIKLIESRDTLLYEDEDNNGGKKSFQEKEHFVRNLILGEDTGQQEQHR